MKSAITVSLVPQARGGPFVFWDDVEAACRKALALGFDAVEVFPPSPAALESAALAPILDKHRLKLAAVGTGGGWVVHKLTLTSADSSVRSRAIEFISGMIDAAGRMGAPVIVGSMQGRWDDATDRPTVLSRLRDALNVLGNRAGRYGVPLMFEPLNRYETNLVNTLGDGLTLLRGLDVQNVRLLADLFHMNIEEADLAGSIRAAGSAVGHVHFADSNRWPVGAGHTEMNSVARALADIQYDGYVSAECFPLPDSDTAAAMTIESFRRYFR